MSVERVREYLKQYGLDGRVKEFSVSSATVELAAQAVGVEAARIAKTLSFHLGEGCVLVVGSGSGETGGLVQQAQKAKMAGAKLAVLTTAPESTLAAMADAVAVVPAPTKEKAGGSVLPMGSLFDEGLLLVCDWLVAYLMEQCGVTEADMKARHANLE